LRYEQLYKVLVLRANRAGENEIAIQFRDEALRRVDEERILDEDWDLRTAKVMSLTEGRVRRPSTDVDLTQSQTPDDWNLRTALVMSSTEAEEKTPFTQERVTYDYGDRRNSDAMYYSEYRY
jgi:hypothetical protein